MLPFVVAVLVYLATPHRVGAAGYLNVRLAPLVTLLALATLRPRDDLGGAVPLAMAAVATLMACLVAIFVHERTEVIERREHFIEEWERIHGQAD